MKPLMYRRKPGAKRHRRPRHPMQDAVNALERALLKVYKRKGLAHITG